MGWDRVKASLFALVRASKPRLDYMAPYRGTVVSQSGQTVDVTMDDPRMPGMSGLPLQAGIPGLFVKVLPGARVFVAFENGDPAKPVACLWDQGAHVLSVSITGLKVELGGQGLLPTDGVVTGLAVDTFTGSTQFALGNVSAAVLASKIPVP